VFEVVSSYRRTVGRGVARLLGEPAADGASVFLRHQEVSKGAREELEATLRLAVRDDAVVRQLATTVVGQVR